MITSESMRSRLPDPLFDTKRVAGLSQDDRALIEAGWIVGPQGGLLLRWGSRCFLGERVLPRDEARESLGDDEYEVNDIHVDIRDLGPPSEEYLRAAIQRGLTIAMALLSSAAGLPGSETLTAVVGMPCDLEDELAPLQSPNLRFFTRRGRYPAFYLDGGHLARFACEAVAVLEISDLPVT